MRDMLVTAQNNVAQQYDELNKEGVKNRVSDWFIKSIKLEGAYEILGSLLKGMDDGAATEIPGTGEQAEESKASVATESKSEQKRIRAIKSGRTRRNKKAVK